MKGNKDWIKKLEQEEMAIVDRYPDPDECHHEFSERFQMEMQSLIEFSKKHPNGGVTPIWDEDNQRYI